MSPLPKIRLTQRDERVLVVGGGLILVLAVVFGWVLPTSDQIQRLDRAIAAEQQTLQTVQRLYGAVQELSERESKVQDQLKRRTAEAFSVASVIEGMARDTKIMEQVQYLKPEQAKVSDQYRETSVSLKVVEISPAQLMDFLYRVESSDRLLRVRNLQIRNSAKEKGKLDVTLTVFTLLPATATVRSPEPSTPQPPPGNGGNRPAANGQTAVEPRAETGLPDHPPSQAPPPSPLRQRSVNPRSPRPGSHAL